MVARKLRGPSVFVSGNLTFQDDHEDKDWFICINGEVLSKRLPPLCMYVLRVLIWHQGSVLSREQIERCVGRNHIKSVKSVAMAISKIKDSLKNAGWDREIEATGSGYTISKAKVMDNSRVRSAK